MQRNRGFYNDNDTKPTFERQETIQEPEEDASWNIFEDTPRKPDTGSSNDSEKYEFMVKSLKIVAYIVVFLVVLSSAVVSKGTLLLMTSQVKANTIRPFCNQSLDVERKFTVELPKEERVVWIWVLVFVYFIPQFGTFFRSLRVCLFKTWKKDNLLEMFLPLFITETLPAIGSAILVFCVLPELDVLKGAMLTNAFCFVPAVIAFISRNPDNVKKIDASTVMILDFLCILAQLTSFFMWPLIERNSTLILIPISGIFISFGWWENYVDENAKFEFIRKLAIDRRVFDNKTYFLYIFTSITNCLIFFATTVVIFWMKEGEFNFLFENFDDAFSNRLINVTEVKMYVEELSPAGLDDTFTTINPTVEANVWTPLTILIINFLSSYICYAFTKFACKVSIQEFSFAFAINQTVPVLISILIVMTGKYLEDECSHTDLFPAYLFFNPPPFYVLKDFLKQQYAWIWLIWLFSQVWVTMHIWNPKCEKLSKTEKLFMKPMYDAFLIDQSVCMNRRRNDSTLQADKMEEATNPKVYVCATMWHENEEEMQTFLKSIMRLDEDNCAHHIAKYHMHADVPTFYELECNIFFDDAFIRKKMKDEKKIDNDPMLNSYVLTLFSQLTKAASDVHGVDMELRPPKIYSTPYGGRIVWTLPGRTKLIAHLKDKAKIRAKKRWSQVMYMYYLLGYRLVPEMKRGKASSKNTYILALDGDIDFKPEAMHLLIEYMRKNNKLGAACGRIHPVGSGAIAWYQVFEYAVGHWLQKATEHVVGCVLCSPGCFSLFRAEVLMQDRVMKKYTSIANLARHRVQYDQGEDRWLCTLILQAGYRVEYSAASDSYTHCPEGFNEFYNQRRRWIPSTMANIIDVLSDYKHIVEINDDISMIYIFYQVVLLIGTVIGPGTIFMMLVGAAVTVFQMDQWTSFLVNLVPILIFIFTCALFNDKIQLMVAGILSSIYGLIMMAVMIGVLLQIHDDGVLAPSSLFFFFMLSEFFVAAILHPKEFYCLKYGIIYYVTVPSMYMLLMIFSVFNMNNVSWGTRDITTVPEQVPQEEKKESATGEKKKEGFFAFLEDQKDKIKEEGSLGIACSGLFNCLFCTHPSEEYEKLIAIKVTLEEINRKLGIIEHKRILTEQPVKVEATTEKEPSDDFVMSNSWFYHKEIMNGQVEWLDDREEKFWHSLIKEYLSPLDESHKQVPRHVRKQ
ncbi:chitin synthase chs-2-like isoform X2 [Coccinella septempunctata]|uniref:chitin synthase chs-2-like isoform X2 n=1 Tax=Coccinella septempunctata TaxID=41139 RepID=UPI001D077306|nr:chitin synthase chs-2-like isoform X2 [Coccinella septempunctata]